MLHQFVTTRRAELITRTRSKVAQRLAPSPTELELTLGIPLFLDQLAEALRLASPEAIETIKTTASKHGGNLLRQGFTVGQVVHGYGDVCQAVTELAEETNEPISTDEFHALNRCLDDAMAEAVTRYTQLYNDRVAGEETERAGTFAHELRNRLNATMLAFAMLKNGTAPVNGSVATVAARNLQRMKTLIDQSLVDVRLDSGTLQRERVSLQHIIEEAEIDGGVEADVRGISLNVTLVESVAAVEVDRQVLSGAIANLLQNAFKFTARGGHVALSTSRAGDHVEINVEDECGGLPAGKAEELFGAFQQRGKDRSGLGLGLFISRKGVEACGGTLRVRDLPEKGCLFTIDLPCANASA